MTKIFVKKEDLKLINGGYLVAGEKELPVFHKKFIYLQRRARYIVEFAKAAKKYDFVGKKADSIKELKQKVLKELDSERIIEYITVTKEPKTPISSKLREEALAFIEFDVKKNETEKVNKFLQDFNCLTEFEEFGLYFDDSHIVKLEKIYTMAEIVKAVKDTINLL